MFKVGLFLIILVMLIVLVALLVAKKRDISWKELFDVNIDKYANTVDRYKDK